MSGELLDTWKHSKKSFQKMEVWSDADNKNNIGMNKRKASRQ